MCNKRNPIITHFHLRKLYKQNLQWLPIYLKGTRDGYQYLVSVQKKINNPSLHIFCSLLFAIRLNIDLRLRMYVTGLAFSGCGLEWLRLMVANIEFFLILPPCHPSFSNPRVVGCGYYFSFVTAVRITITAATSAKFCFVKLLRFRVAYSGADREVDAVRRLTVRIVGWLSNQRG